MIYRTLRLLAIIAGISFATGCKLAVIVPPGGVVQSSSGIRNCDGGSEGNYCTFDITDASLPFSESFTALAKPGYQFLKWQNGDGFQCGKSTNPTCTITLLDNPFNVAIKAFFEIGYLMPVFKDLGFDADGDGIRNELDEDDDNDGILDIDDTCPEDPSSGCTLGVPLTDFVIINGSDWAQVDLFNNLSWNQVNAVCPGGPCSGVLNGYNMAGWTWASRIALKELFGFYVCQSMTSGCYGGYAVEVNSTWAPVLFGHGMRPTSENSTSRSIWGWTKDTNPDDPTFSAPAYWLDYKPLTGSQDAAFLSFGNFTVDHVSGGIGGWFYRNR